MILAMTDDRELARQRRARAKAQFDRIMRKDPVPYDRNQPAGRRGDPKITDRVMEKYLDDYGFSTRQAAAAYLHEHGIEITAAAVSFWRKTHGGTIKEDAPYHADLIPWRVKVQHRTPASGFSRSFRIYKALQTIAATRVGKRPPQEQAVNLEIIQQQLRDLNAVVHYDPELGLVLVPRRDGIDKGLIREPNRRDDGSTIPPDLLKNLL